MIEMETVLDVLVSYFPHKFFNSGKGNLFSWHRWVKNIIENYMVQGNDYQATLSLLLTFEMIVLLVREISPALPQCGASSARIQGKRSILNITSTVSQTANKGTPINKEVLN